MGDLVGMARIYVIEVPAAIIKSLVILLGNVNELGLSIFLHQKLGHLIRRHPPKKLILFLSRNPMADSDDISCSLGSQRFLDAGVNPRCSIYNFWFSLFWLLDTFLLVGFFHHFTNGSLIETAGCHRVVHITCTGLHT